MVIKDALTQVYDVEKFLKSVNGLIHDQGRVVIVQYNSLWEPVLKLASKFGFRRPMKEVNWLSMADLKNFAYLSGFEVVKSGTKMIIT